MPAKRFDEDEAAAIFQRAAELEQRAPTAMSLHEGMTLEQLQAIGAEAGLNPELVARAAAMPVAASATPIRHVLGIPVGVGHTIELGRTLGDAEWERLVVDLRETFDARGVIRVEGGFRQWTNGNLQVLVEPMPTGHRIRFRTVNGQARRLIRAGGVFAAIGGVFVALSAAFGGAAMEGMVLAALGAGMFTVGAVRLPGWARARREQMEAVAERAVARQIGR
jgi:hypothetical protein